MSLVRWIFGCLRFKCCLISAFWLVQTNLAFAEPNSIAAVKSVRLISVLPQPNLNLQPGWSLSAEFDIFLGFKLQEAAERGLPLNFSVDFQLIQQRWYWSDARVVTKSFPISLSYHALTRTYRLQHAEDVLVFSSLNDAIARMSVLSNWLVIRKDQIEMGKKYLAKVRFSLNLSEMPKPFQVNALTNSQWDLSSGWVQFDFLPNNEELG